MNYIIFNHDGSIKNVNFAEIIVQGNNLVDEIFVAVEGRSTDSYLATAYFELPNGDSNFLTATTASQSIDQSAYNGYKFLLTGAQTAFYGRVRMSLKLEGMQGETLWTYEQVLTINKSGYNPDFTMITMSQYAALVQAMGSLQEKFVVNNARFYSSLANAQADLDNLAFNQCVIIADTTATDPIPEIYFKNGESQLELLAGIGEYTFQVGTTTTQTLSPGSDATVSVSFVASGKTITMNFTFGIPRGNTGATGNGIASIAKVSTVGLVDTYRITYTNGNHFDFAVTNGTLAGKMVSNESFVYDSGSTYTLSEQLARFIYDLIEADKNKLKQIVAYKPNNGGPGDSYNIVWRYANSLYGGGAGNFYYLNDSDGSLLTIDGHLESYNFSIFYEVDGITVADIGYFELSSSDTDGYLDDDQAQEANKTVCLIKRGNDIFHFAQEYEGTKYFKTIPLMRVTGYKQGSIEINGLDSNSPTWEYASEDYDMDSAPTQNSPNLVTSGGVHSAVSALDSKISKNAEDIATLTEALIKKDLYETQEATFQGMTAVPAGAMVKAYLDGFKGNSAVVNQLVQNGNFESADGWSAFDGTLSVSNNTARISFSENAPASARLQRGGFSFVAGHTYLITATVSSSISNTAALGYFITSSVVLSDESIGRTFKKTLYSLFTPSASGTGNIRLFINRGGTGTTGDYVDIENFMLIDLTLAGLTSAEMADAPTAKAALKPKGMDVDYYIPYNAGTLTDSKPTKLYSRNAILKNLSLKSIGAYTFTGNETFYMSSNNRFTIYVNAFPNFKIPADNTVIVSAYVEGYTAYGANDFSVHQEDMSISCPYSPTTPLMTFRNSTFNDVTLFKASLVGKTMYYEITSTAQTISQAVIDGLVEHEYDLTMPYLKSALSVQDDAYDGNKGTDKVTKLTYNPAISPIAIQGPGTANERVLLYFNGVPLQITPNSTVKYDITTNRYIADTGDNVYLHTRNKTISLTSVAGIGVNVIGFHIYDSELIGKTTSEIATALQGLVINVGVLPSEPFSDPISYPEIVDVYAGGSIEVVGEGCDATTKVYFYVEA